MKFNHVWPDWPPDHLPALSVYTLSKMKLETLFTFPLSLQFGIRAFLFVKGPFQQGRVDPSAHRAWILSPLIDYLPPFVSRRRKLRLGVRWKDGQLCNLAFSERDQVQLRARACQQSCGGRGAGVPVNPRRSR